MPHVDNKRIAKNTLLLYGRMGISMLVSLYTSRIVLEALGENDYGIYNVVGGFVAMFSLISGSLSAGISRFITFELGRDNQERLNRVFSTSLVVQFGLSAIIVLLAETVGLWFLNCKMNIAPTSMTAANWVFQCSIVSFVVNLISLPYNATIIAHEKMSAFAYISIIEVSFRLLIAFIISAISDNRLITYAILILVTSLIIRFIYTWYSKRHFPETNGKLQFDKVIFKDIASFSGWNFIGASSGLLRDQGVNILLNLFFGTAVNAARGIAVSVNTAIQGFANNFLIAVNPQITKSYAQGEYPQMFRLAFRSSKFAFFIMFLFALPIISNATEILSLWLKDVPGYAVIFTQLSVVYILTEIISYPLVTIMLATGDIRNYQLIVGGIQMLNFPISYLALKFGCVPQVTYIISIVVSFACLSSRLFMLHRMVKLNVLDFLSSVFLRVMLVALLSSGIAYLVSRVITHNLIGTFAAIIIEMLVVAISSYFVGCDNNERLFLTSKVRDFVQSKLGTRTL